MPQVGLCRILLVLLLGGLAWFYQDTLLSLVSRFQAAQGDDALDTADKKSSVLGFLLAFVVLLLGWWKGWCESITTGLHRLFTPKPARQLEQQYLQTLLQDKRRIPLVMRGYVSLAADFCKHSQLDLGEWMPTLYRHEPYLRAKAKPTAQTTETHTDLLQAFRRYQRVVILGEPGAGKTFSLWRIAAEYAQAALKNQRAPIPVVIPLNLWTQPEQSLEAFVVQQMGALASEFARLRHERRLLPLLDALNEIPHEQQAHKLAHVRAWIAEDFPYLVLTCRERNYAKMEQNLDRLTLEPLKPPQIQCFLQNYFAFFAQQGQGHVQQDAEALFWQLAGGEEMQQVWQYWHTHRPSWKTRLRNFWRPYTPADWQHFWQETDPAGWFWENYWWDYTRQQQLKNPRSLLKLAANPYLLNLITLLYAEAGALPASRVALFQAFVQALLARELHEQGKLQAKAVLPSTDLLETELRQLAWALQTASANQQEARTALDYPVAAELMSEAHLEFAQAASLLEITQGQVRFTHQLLQEFFTAQSFKEHREQGWQAQQIWLKANWWEANGWEEAAKLAAEYETEPQALLEWLAAANPKLACEIARDLQLAEALLPFREQWQAAITDVIQYPDAQERHAISTGLAWLNWDQRFGIGLDAQGFPEIDWLDIPAGAFIYQDGESLNLPSFKISRYLITNAQFQAFLQAADGYADPRWWQGLNKSKTTQHSNWQESNRPVERVDWYEAFAFCRWLSAKTGLNISLPTEQQWEKAARGKDGCEYPWGAKFESLYCNAEDNLGETSAVGIYSQGQAPSGAMDMAGNVWEWCLNKVESSDVITPDLSENSRVRRGGSWLNGSVNLRCAVRFWIHPSLRNDDLGFRIVNCPC
jgi:hypothetical protein